MIFIDFIDIYHKEHAYMVFMDLQKGYYRLFKHIGVDVLQEVMELSEMWRTSWVISWGS